MEWKSNVEESANAEKKTQKTLLANSLSALRETLIQETLAVNKQKDMTHDLFLVLLKFQGCRFCFFYSFGNLLLILPVSNFPVFKTATLMLFILSFLSVLVNKVKKLINEVNEINRRLNLILA